MTLTQVAATLASLSGVAGILSPRIGTATSDEATRVLLRDVAGIGLGVALFSFLPLVCIQAAMREELVWRIFSAFAAIFWVVTAVLSIRRLPQRPWVSPFGLLAPATSLIGLTLYGWNVVAPSAISSSRYLGGLTCHLVVGGIIFVATVFENRRL